MVDIDSIDDLICNIKEVMKSYFYPKENVDDLIDTHIHDERYYTENETDTKLATKSDTNHTHTVDSSLSSSSTNPVQNKILTNELNDKADADHTHTVDSSLSSSSTNPVQNKILTNELNEKADTNHTHEIANINNLQATLNTKTDSSHTHDGRYYTESEMDTKLNNKSDTDHTHNNYTLKTDFTNLENKYLKNSSIKIRLIRADSNGVPYSDTEVDNEGTQLQVLKGNKLGARLYTTSDDISLANRTITMYLGGTIRRTTTDSNGITQDMIGLNNGQNNIAFAILKGTSQFDKSIDVKYIEYQT